MNLYRDLVERAVRMLEASVPPAILHDPDSDNPVVAWLAEAHEALGDDGLPHPAELVDTGDGFL